MKKKIYSVIKIVPSQIIYSKSYRSMVKTIKKVSCANNNKYLKKTFLIL